MSENQKAEFQFTIEGNAIAQPRQRFAMRKNKFGKNIMVNYIKEDHPIHAWKRLVALFARQHRPKNWPMDEPVQLSVLFILPRQTKILKYLSGKPTTRLPAYAPAFQVADVDNLVKAIMDAMNGVLWKDDSQVWGLWSKKMYASIDEKPRVIIKLLAGVEPDELK